MGARETVHELEVTVEVTQELPRERGGELRTVAAEHLEALEFVRAAAVVEQGSVDAREDALLVTVGADLTTHFDGPVDGDRVRDRIAEAVVDLDAFEVLAGPYEIEAW